MAIFTPGDDLKRKEQEKLDLMNRQKNYGTYTESDYIKNLRDRALQDKSALDNYGDFKFSKQAMYDQLENSIMNRKPFQYDLDGDALYQMYKDKYIKGGKLAMQDTMGQAAALTGGYGNSYASTAGNQAYQAYLGKLNDVVPELYQLALQRYQLEGDEAKDRLSLLAADRATEYGEYGDRYNRLGDTYNRNYALYGDERGREQSSFEEGYSRLSDALSNAQSEYDSAYNRAYQDFRNNIADQQAAAQLAASRTSATPKVEEPAAITYKLTKDNTSMQGPLAEGKKAGALIGTATYKGNDGKEITVQAGVTPYAKLSGFSGSLINDDVYYGYVEGAPYQPDNVRGRKLTFNGQYDYNANGTWTPIMQTSEGRRYIWDEMKNAYDHYYA